MTNRLANSASPYLLQHAENPVDWWEWEPAAFDEAAARGVPVLLSIGYAACHWCHVMAHESFENEATAAQMNENFVCIKVDREERPDVDAVYMSVTQAMTGHGGWPMTVFLTASAEPFFAGTYFPPQPRHGSASFPQVLAAVSQSWEHKRDAVIEAAAEAVRRLAATNAVEAGDAPPNDDELAHAVAVLGSQFDEASAGFGNAPKFPPSMTLEHLLRHHARTGNARSLEMAQRTLEAMARGGIYDQLAGGFARYSVDRHWVVPHFEKMLYDNALLLRAYAHQWRLDGSPLAEQVVRETAEFLLREMRTEEGGFASALDADTEGVEGRYYVWTPAELRDVLGDEDGTWAAQIFEVTAEGTFEHGASVLQMLADVDDVERRDRVRSLLLLARARRTYPARDDKIVAAWNGLAIAALAEAGALLREPRWIEAAEAAADLLVGLHLGAGVHGDRLARVSRNGVAGRHAGLLEDHACLADGLLALYCVTGHEEWLAFAGVLLDVCLTDFVDEAGELTDTARDAEPLVLRISDPSDNAAPSGRSAAAMALISYAALTGSAVHREAAERALASASSLARSAPRFAGWGLAAAEAALDGPMEVAIVGPLDDFQTRSLHAAALAGIRPGLVVAVGDPRDAPAVPLLLDRPLIHDAPTAYVCRDFVCQAPTTDPVQVARLVAGEVQAPPPS